MEFALVIRDLLGKRRLLALGVVLAAAAAVLSIYRPDGFGLKSRSIVYSAASTQVFIDTPSSILGNVAASTSELQTLASLYANFMASPTLLDKIGAQVGLSGHQIYAAGPVDPNVPRTVQEPTALQRNVQLTGESDPYQLNFTADPNLPQVGIYSQAPTTRMAVALANAAAGTLTAYVTNLEIADKTPVNERAVVRQLGSANGAVVDGGARTELAGLVFVGVFLLWCCLLLAWSRVAAVWHRSGTLHGQRQKPANTNGPREESAEIVEDFEEIVEEIAAIMQRDAERLTPPRIRQSAAAGAGSSSSANAASATSEVLSPHATV